MLNRSQCEWMLVSSYPQQDPVPRIVIDKGANGCVAVANADEKDWFVSDNPFSTVVWYDYKPIPQKKTRPMTNAEMRGFIANTPGIEIRHTTWSESDWTANSSIGAFRNPKDWQYRTISLTGEAGEPMKFDVEVSDDTC